MLVQPHVTGFSALFAKRHYLVAKLLDPVEIMAKQRVLLIVQIRTKLARWWRKFFIIVFVFRSELGFAHGAIVIQHCNESQMLVRRSFVLKKTRWKCVKSALAAYVKPTQQSSTHETTQVRVLKTCPFSILLSSKGSSTSMSPSMYAKYVVHTGLGG